MNWVSHTVVILVNRDRPHFGAARHPRPNSTWTCATLRGRRNRAPDSHHSNRTGSPPHLLVTVGYLSKHEKTKQFKITIMMHRRQTTSFPRLRSRGSLKEKQIFLHLTATVHRLSI